jgi:hypothetical protein
MASAPTARAFSSRDGTTSATTKLCAPLSLYPMVAPRPIGPAPNTTTESPGFAPVRLTAWRATAIGSLSAATSSGTSSGMTARL